MRQAHLILITIAALSLLPVAQVAAADAGTAVTLPADVPSPEVSPADAVSWTYHAFVAGEYWAAAGMVLLALVGLLRRFAGRIPKIGRWLTTTDDGGTIFALIVSAGAVLGAGLIVDGDISWRLVETALLYGGSATAAWSVAWKRLLRPILARVFD